MPPTSNPSDPSERSPAPSPESSVPEHQPWRKVAVLVCLRYRDPDRDGQPRPIPGLKSSFISTVEQTLNFIKLTVTIEAEFERQIAELYGFELREDVEEIFVEETERAYRRRIYNLDGMLGVQNGPELWTEHGISVGTWPDRKGYYYQPAMTVFVKAEKIVPHLGRKVRGEVAGGESSTG